MLLGLSTGDTLTELQENSRITPGGPFSALGGCELGWSRGLVSDGHTSALLVAPG